MAKKKAAKDKAALSNNAGPFIEEISSGANKEVERILSRARRTAEARLEAAKKQANAQAEEVLGTATARAELERRRIISDLNLEMKKIVLRARGELVQEVLTKVRARLEASRGTPEYRTMLAGFVIEGIVALDQPEVSVSISPADAAMANDAFLQEAAAACGRRVKVSRETDLDENEMGAVVRAADGSVLYDNTIGARMERLADELQLIVSREVFSEATGTA